VLITHLIAAVPVDDLKHAALSLGSYHDAAARALDLLVGF